jgi:CRP-like cAMP-binding protein
VVAVSTELPDARRQIIVFLFPGDLCGLVQSNGRYAFDYEAITETTTCAAGMSRIGPLANSNPDLAELLKDQLLRAHNRVSEQLVAIGQLSAKERVVYFLRRLGQSYAERGMPSQPLLLPMSRLDIADHLGMRIETLSRVLTQLQTQDIIDLQDANTIVLNSAATDLLVACRH